MSQEHLDQWQCAGCAVEFPPGAQPEGLCPICADERQYIPGGTQRWMRTGDLVTDGHELTLTELEPGLTAIASPEIGIGQSALLVQTTGGNLLFDVPGLITEQIIAWLQSCGGLAGIVASHPHMYGVQQQYSQAFGGVPIYVAQADARWVQYSSSAIKLWKDAFEVLPSITLKQLGGHFPGSTVACWQAGADGRGVLLAGDAIFPVADGNVTFLRSYPNRIPLSAPVVRRMAKSLEELEFDRLYNNFASCVRTDAQRIVQFSADRYARWVSGEFDHLT
ncbi:hydrolase [Glutamicibacter halophytocola]|uniref:Hydrolase n=1 Tax=Glutamicibacter halophytocola TaxID=1933880 RepID=A0AA94XQP5_9MICC|nr:hydrolase [Glutamicibacter halophytocola]UUX58656.1 hydrolase [Glutamicibacter halophytocola]